ncbi:MAG: hypothetical protein L0226_00080 [Acidobacteria bacterium]|nr:hypothetical protein [Acidobacteriota bacterium]MCI0590134.1 hypothetical protein [Gammaproteobacteria bacterium]
MKSTSTSETLYPDDSDASESYKLVRLARTFRAQWADNTGSEINVYGYLTTEAKYNTIKEKDERVVMRQRMDYVRNTLNEMGVPKDKVWVGGVAFSSHRGGQIDLFIRDGKSNAILPPYPPYVSPSSPKQPSPSKDQWLDADTEISIDPVKREIEAEVELSYKEPSGNRKILPKASIKFSITSNGSLSEVGAELTLLKQKLARQILWGVAQDVKISVKAVGLIDFASSSAERITGELNAKFKAALSANLAIPDTRVKIPVELSLYVDAGGELGLAPQVTIIEF